MRGTKRIESMPKKGEHKYSEEYLAGVAAKYSTVKEFVEKDSCIYKAIKRYGLFEKLCEHLKYERVPSYSYEELVEIASRYDDLVLFKKEQPRIYSVIYQRGLYEELCSHMKRGKRGDYTDEELAEIASRYNDEKEFYSKCHGVFLAIYKRGLLDTLCGHMKKRGSWYKRKIYVFEFADGCAYVGLSRYPEKRYKQHVGGKSILRCSSTFRRQDLTMNLRYLPTGWRKMMRQRWRSNTARSMLQTDG